MTVCFKMHSLSFWLIIALWITMFNKIFFLNSLLKVSYKYQYASKIKNLA